MTVWALEEALVVVRDLQPVTRDYDYHLCLGGGVLNKGTSEKDVDLYFLPLCNKADADPQGLVDLLVERWGPAEPIGEYGLDNNRLKLMFSIGGKRADVFIWLLEGEEKATWLQEWIADVSKAHKTPTRRGSTSSGRVRVSPGRARHTSY